jgi:hypothetical protein
MMAGLVVGLLVGGSMAAPIGVREQADPITAVKDDMSLVGHPAWGTDSLIHTKGTVDKHVDSKKVHTKKYGFTANVAPKAVAGHMMVSAKSETRKMQIETHTSFPDDLTVTFDNCEPCMETMYEPSLDGDIYQDTDSGSFRYYKGAKFQTLAECQQYLCTTCDSFAKPEMSVYNCK